MYENYYNSTGTHYISNSGSDENGNITGGQAGDQGGEWNLRSWYERPWTCVLRHPDEKVRLKIAELSCAAALNQNIGYDQSNRYSYWYQLASSGYDPSKIAKACESDCSAGVCSNVRATGYLLGYDALKNIPITSTYYMRTEFVNAGFKCLTDSKYTKSADYLLPGDILLNDSCHTAVNITKGSKPSATVSTTASTTSKQNLTTELSIPINENGRLSTQKKYTGIVTDRDPDGLNVRIYAGTDYAKCSFSGLKYGTKVAVCDAIKSCDGAKWYYIYIEKGSSKLYGFVHSGYVKLKQ